MDTPLHPVPVTVKRPPNRSEQKGALENMLNDKTGVVIAYPAFLDELHVKKASQCYQHDTSPLSVR